mmetsp:Transcript_24042/g.19771  ORF Transcript_24042/g.19771 Transcript_24042/m.19771 type:complete len:99 (-) Transcript_24042:8-304(-)
MSGIGKVLGGGGIQYNAQCICDASGNCITCHAKLDLLEAAVGLPHKERIEEDFGRAVWYGAECKTFYPIRGLANCSEEELQVAMSKCWAFDRNAYGGP